MMDEQLEGRQKRTAWSVQKLVSTAVKATDGLE